MLKKYPGVPKHNSRTGTSGAILAPPASAAESSAVIASASASMEPPKKRKFFSDNLEKGVSVGHGVALDHVQFEASVPSKQDIPVFSAGLLEQQNIVNSSVGGGEVTAARRNRRKYSVDFKVDS